MAGLDVREMLAQAEVMLERASTMLQSRQADEYVGTAADEMVSATLADGRTTISLHVLAKRRLDREELGAAIVEAVRSAEQQSQAAVTAFFEEDHGANVFSPRGQALFRDTMDRLRARLPY